MTPRQLRDDANQPWESNDGTARSPDVWVFSNGSKVLFRGSLAECADAWSSATGSDKWHGSVKYESGDLTYDQQADKLLGLADFMEHPEFGWIEPADQDHMREQMRQLGRQVSASMDAIVMDAFVGCKPTS